VSVGSNSGFTSTYPSAMTVLSEIRAVRPTITHACDGFSDSIRPGISL